MVRRVIVWGTTISLVLAIPIWMLAATGSRITEENSKRVQVGMKLQDVIGILDEEPEFKRLESYSRGDYRGPILTCYWVGSYGSIAVAIDSDDSSIGQVFAVEWLPDLKITAFDRLKNRFFQR